METSPDTQTEPKALEPEKARALLAAFSRARLESRKLQAQSRKTNKALAELEDRLESYGIKAKERIKQ